MMSRLQIRLPELEIQYEGSEAFMRDELLALVRAIADQVRHGRGLASSSREQTGNEAGDPSATPRDATATSPGDTGTVARDPHLTLNERESGDRESREPSRSRGHSSKKSEKGGSREPAPIRRPNGGRRGPKASKAQLPAVAEAKGSAREKVLDVNGVASRLNARTAVELTLSSAAFLALVQHQERFDRRAIARTVQSADAFKPSVLSNLTKSLDGLIRRGDLERKGRGQYALSAATSERLAALI